MKKPEQDPRRAGRHPERVYDCYSHKEVRIVGTTYLGTTKFYRKENGDLISPNWCIPSL